MNKNIKKYSGLSMIMGTVLVLSGCGQVKPVEQEDNFSNNVDVSVDVVNNTNSTTTVLTTPVVTTTTEVKPFAYAGYGYSDYIESQEDVSEVEPFAYKDYIEFEKGLTVDSETVVNESSSAEVAISSCSCTKDIYGQYAYLRYDDTYTITNDDSLQELCGKFNMTVNQFYQLNSNVKSFVPGTVVKHPVMDELYIAKKGESVSAISIETGVDMDTIISKNSLSDDILESDTYLLLHKFNSDENSYITNKGVVNIINDNRIYGNKIIQASGFAGASRKMLVLNESVYSYGVNDVVLYTFNEDNSYTSQVVCSNAKDIISVDGMPIALLRNTDDIEALATSVHVPCDSMAYMQWESTVSDNCAVCTSGNTNYVIMNGSEINDLNVDNSFVKTK